ncbi:MAG: pyridoxamine 5'-phosphate oxidase family protein [Actinomycetota bacterium]|nr:pyridoxamine 5'-phosphate oxidase family protein [Actinomycetota bacterium]
MHETPEQLDRLQALLDASATAAGAHLRSIVIEERRVDAGRLCALLTGMRLLTVATVTADGRPIAGPVDGYFLHGAFWFSTSRHSVRAQHLSMRPAVSATHVPHERLAVSAHGMAVLFSFPGSETDELRQAMLDHYLPLQGASFEEWLEGMSDGVAGRIDARKLFAFSMPDS